MRFLKQVNLNRRAVTDINLYANTATGQVTMGSTNNVIVPTGTTAQRPANPVNGMVRYNTDITTGGQLEIYQSSKWRSLRFKESGTIIQQNLGAGDSNNTYFGPLNAAYNPSNVDSTNTTFGGQNIIVVVENVIQLSSLNYTVVQNPTLPLEAYSPTLSVAATTSSTVLYFNTNAKATTASWSSNVATVTFASTYVDQTGATITRTQVPFAVGATITVTGFSPSGYNGVFTVTGGTATTVTYALLSNPGTIQYADEVTASGATPAVYPSVPLTSAPVTGTGIFITGAGTTVSSYSIDSATGALVSTTISHVPTAGISVNAAVTVTEASQSISNNSYYLKFSTPVPYGKLVIALLGFDQ
jgi:hypothetical protein